MKKLEKLKNWRDSFLSLKNIFRKNIWLSSRVFFKLTRESGPSPLWENEATRTRKNGFNDHFEF